MKLRIYILTTIGLLFSGLLKAQFPTNLPQGGNGFPNPNGQNNNGFPASRDPKTTQKQTKTDGRVGLDDSTKVIYGPTSTKYFLEEDVVNNRKILYNIDTTLDGIHNFNFIQRNKNTYQDLGNLGTAIRPIYYKAPEQIGTLLGYDAYTLYDIKPGQVKYYNTKSPFSNIVYIPGGGEQDLLQFEFSRNVDSLWNLGIHVQRISSNKTLVDRSAINDNTAINHWDFTIHSNYQTRNGKYSLLGFINLADRNVNDQGGVVLEQGRDYNSMLLLDGNKPILTTASSRDKSYNFHLYHEYVGYKAFQIYQTIDYQTRNVKYRDLSFAVNWQNGFYPFAYKRIISKDSLPYTNSVNATTRSQLVLDSLYNENKYSNFEVKTGIKGFYKGFNYRLHLRTRFFGLTNPYISNPVYSNTGKNETFLGLWLNQYFKDSTRVFGELEFTVNPFFNNFRVNGEFQGKWLNVGGSVTTVTPTLVQNSMFNNGFRWENENTSKNVKTTNIYAYTNLKFGQITLHPNADLNWISSYIYFDENAFAEQTDNEILIYKIGLGLDYRWKKFSTTNQFLFSKSNNEDLIKIPTFNFTTRLAFDLLYKKKLFIQTGFDINYQSGYQGYAYMPAIQQFHLQRESQGQSVYNIQGYAQVDVFADVRINRVRLSLKFANANYRLPLNGSGYYASPGFSGMGRVLAFGLHWLLFD